MAIKIIPRVVDLSHYDDVQDGFQGAVKFGIWGAINKVTENTSVLDHSFDWRRDPAAKAGLLYGAYHFLRPGRVEQQVDWFLKNCGDTNGLLLGLDYEDKNVPLIDAKNWLKILHDKTGRWAKFYLGGEVRGKINSDSFWKNFDLWHPQYGPSPNKVPKQWKSYWLWQYSGDGLGPNPHNVPGIVIHGGKGIDINHYNGSLEDLKSSWAT